MLFMVIETFEGDDMVPACARLEARGRMLSAVLCHEGSWVEAGFRRCFQLMRTDDAALLQDWVPGWRGAGVRFEIVPVVESARTRTLVARHRDGEG